MTRGGGFLSRIFDLVTGAKPKAATPSEFTAAFAQAMQQMRPDLQVRVVCDLELKVATPDGQESASFLDNAFAQYTLDPTPAHQAEVIQRFADAALTIAGNKLGTVDRASIVPIIKDRAWLQETRQALLARGATNVAENVYDDVNEELVIVYAEDSPKNIRYISPDDLEQAGIARNELRALACENLLRIVPKIERHGEDGTYMLIAGGDYEASLLAVDALWDPARFDVDGDIVVAIPSRDVLLITGSNDEEGIDRLQQAVEHSSGPYSLTARLFVFRNGKLEVFNAD